MGIDFSIEHSIAVLEQLKTRPDGKQYIDELEFAIRSLKEQQLILCSNNYEYGCWTNNHCSYETKGHIKDFLISIENT